MSNGEHILRLATGKTVRSNRVKNITMRWEDFVTLLRDPKVQPGERSYILPGWCDGGIRNEKNVKRTCLATIDIDDKDGSLGLKVTDLVSAVDLFLNTSWAIYTTRSYDGMNACCRLVIPFAEDVPAHLHKSMVDKVVSILPTEWRKAVDGVSYLPYQASFLPCVKAKGDPFEFFTGGSGFLLVGDIVNEVIGASENTSEDNHLLELAISNQPRDISDEEVDSLLDQIDPCGLSYGLDEGIFGWANVIAALAHQYAGSEAGLNKAIRWSKKNVEKFNHATTVSKYRSLARGNKLSPITMGSVINHVDRAEHSSEAWKPILDQLMVEAEDINDTQDYCNLRDKLGRISLNRLPEDARSMIAGIIYSGSWNGGRLTKTEIKKAIRPNEKSGVISNETLLPDWAMGWCYIEKMNQFYHINSAHSITKDAFNARFNRMIECRELGMHASTLTTDYWGIPTYADLMYWPGAGRVFEHKGQTYLNNYSPCTLELRAPESTSDQEAIQFIENHFKTIISNDGDRSVLLDWLSYVYRNPGKRVNWSPVLQGAQGIGKTFISVMMTALMGRGNSTTIDGSTISGTEYNEWGEGKVLCVVEEVRVSGSNKYEVMDRIKPFITNSIISIHEKYRSVREVPNFTSYLFITNHKDAIPIDKNDRRYAIIYSGLQSKDDLMAVVGEHDGGKTYFNKLFSIINNHSDLIGHWLKNRPYSDSFNPEGHAPITGSREEALNLSSNSVDDTLEDLIDKYQCDVINSIIVDTTYLHQLCQGEGDKLPKMNALKSSLLGMGLSLIPGKRMWVKKLRRRHIIWYRKDTLKQSDVEKVVEDFFDKNDGEPDYF